MRFLSLKINVESNDLMTSSGTVLLYQFSPDANVLHCFNLTAVDDEHIESTEEYHRIFLKTVNQLDNVNVNVTTITIIDNDGKQICVILAD